MISGEGLKNLSPEYYRSQKMKKILIVLGLLVGLCGMSFAGWTEENSSGCENDHYVGDLTVYDDAVITDDLTVSGTTKSEILGTSGTLDVTVTTPTFRGQIAVNSSNSLVYIATATTGVASWSKIGAQ
jgi:hypothetical protein